MLLIFLIGLVSISIAQQTTSQQTSQQSNFEHPIEQFFSTSNASQPHTENWALIVCTSRFWFNYRHIANALSMYRVVKKLGIPDR